MNKQDLADFHQSLHEDNVAYTAGRLSHDEFWARVHTRDAIVRAATRSQRRQLNAMGAQCGCEFCRTMPIPGCQCAHCR